MLVDSHCHLDFNDFEEDFDEILELGQSQWRDGNAECRK